MDILLTIVMMLLLGALCFMIGAFAQETSGIFQFRDRTEEETTREIVIKVDTENLKECANEAIASLTKMLAAIEGDIEDDEDEDEDE